jgi:hypothetical protein
MRYSIHRLPGWLLLCDHGMVHADYKSDIGHTRPLEERVIGMATGIGVDVSSLLPDPACIQRPPSMLRACQ